MPEANDKTVRDRGASSRDRILGAAERQFAEDGFNGCSLRQVARTADVPFSLVTYHFGDKRGLYRELFRARAPELVQQRLAGLALADLEENRDRRAELIVRALLVPMLRLRSTETGRRFATLLAREATDPMAKERGVLKEVMAPVADAAIPRLLACFPDRDRAEILWGYAAMIGATMCMLAGAPWLGSASDGPVDPDDVQATTLHLTAIALAGLYRAKDPRADT